MSSSLRELYFADLFVTKLQDFPLSATSKGPESWLYATISTESQLVIRTATFQGFKPASNQVRPTSLSITWNERATKVLKMNGNAPVKLRIDIYEYDQEVEDTMLATSHIIISSKSPESFEVQAPLRSKSRRVSGPALGAHVGHLLCEIRLIRYELNDVEYGYLLWNSLVRLATILRPLSVPLTRIWTWSMWERPGEAFGILCTTLYFSWCMDIIFWLPFALLFAMGVSYLCNAETAANYISNMNNDNMPAPTGLEQKNEFEKNAKVTHTNRFLDYILHCILNYSRTNVLAWLISCLLISVLCSLSFCIGANLAFFFLILPEYIEDEYLQCLLSEIGEDINARFRLQTRYPLLLKRLKCTLSSIFRRNFNAGSKSDLSTLAPSLSLVSSGSETASSRSLSREQSPLLNPSSSGIFEESDSFLNEESSITSSRSFKIDSSHCAHCQGSFGILKRRKTCDSCGQKFCNRCVRDSHEEDLCAVCSYIPQSLPQLILGQLTAGELKVQMTFATLFSVRSNSVLTEIVAKARAAPLVLRLIDWRPVKFDRTALMVSGTKVRIYEFSNLHYDSKTLSFSGTIYGVRFQASVVQDTPNETLSRKLYTSMDLLLTRIKNQRKHAVLQKIRAVNTLARSPTLITVQNGFVSPNTSSKK